MDDIEKILLETCPEYRSSVVRSSQSLERVARLRRSLSGLVQETPPQGSVLKNAAMTVGGMVLFLLLQIYSLLPLVGALSVVVGIVGFCIGAAFALRAFVAGLVMLAVKPIVGAVFLKILERHSSRPQDSGGAQPQGSHSKIPVEITKEDIAAYEREQLEACRNDPAYNFDN